VQINGRKARRIYIYIYIPWANVKKRGLKNKDRGNKNNSLHIENL
jgi:hypothetical protein